MALRRRVHPKRCWASWIWDSFIPPDSSTFLWKLLRHALPVDTRIPSRGIYLASRCRCCSVQTEDESLVHFFIHSEVARQVCTYFANILRLSYGYSSILQAFNIWMAGILGTSQYGIARILCSAYIFREIWVARCGATYYEENMSVRSICSKVLNRIRILSLVVKPKKGSNLLQGSIIERLGIRKQPTLIKRGVDGIGQVPGGLN